MGGHVHPCARGELLFNQKRPDTDKFYTRGRWTDRFTHNAGHVRGCSQTTLTEGFGGVIVMESSADEDSFRQLAEGDFMSFSPLWAAMHAVVTGKLPDGRWSRLLPLFREKGVPLKLVRRHGPATLKLYARGGGGWVSQPLTVGGVCRPSSLCSSTTSLGTSSTCSGWTATTTGRVCLGTTERT